MKKILIVAALILGAVVAHAEYLQVDNGIKFLRERFWAGDVQVESFEDTRTGIICYLAYGYNGRSGMSCLKK